MKPLTQHNLRSIFRRHYGATTAIARELGVNKNTISQWFRGRTSSKRIDAAIRARAVQLLDKERAELSASLQK